MSAEGYLDDLTALSDAADVAEFDLTLVFEQVAQKVAAGDSFTTGIELAGWAGRAVSGWRR
jgi:hypothetical protein